MAYQFQFRGGTTQEWEAANPVLAEREIGVVANTETGERNFIIGDGASKYTELTQYAFGASAYDILRKHGGYKGTVADFCRQLDNFTRYGEQQVGQLVNAGAGWNSFTFPQEFSEEVYVTLTPVDCACYAAVRNVTKQGFFYCLYDKDGNTTSGNEVVNWNACTVSELNLAHAMAQAAGLNPFDYDNLTQLFTAHAAEVVANEAAMSMVRGSSMASGRYLCHLAGLNPDSFVNVFSIAKDITAMNTVCQDEECMAFIATSQAAKDSIRLSEMGTCKYALALAGLDCTSYDSMAALCENEADITTVAASATAMEAVAASATAMEAVAASATSLIAIALSEVAIGAVFGDETAFGFIDNEQSMGVLSASPVAMAALAASPVALRAIALSATRETFEASEHFAEEILETDSGIAMYAAACAGLEPEDWPSMQALAASAVAMQSIAASAVSLSAIASSETARNAVLNSEHWDEIAENDRAMTRYALALAGRDTEEFTSLATLAASATAMAAVAASATALLACARSAVAINHMVKSAVAKDKLTEQNTLLQQQRLEIYNTVKNNSTYFTLSRAQKDDDSVASANITGTNYIVFAIPGSYGSASSSKQTTMFHGHNGSQVVQRYGSYTDENYVYVGLGGATFTEQGDGEVRTWVYTAK